MLIREWMTKDVITVTPDTSMLKASKLMKDHNIRRLPVLDGKRVVGIVSDRDIRAASPSKATTLDMHELYYLLSEVKVKDIMTSDPVTVYDTDAVDAAALLMENKGIGGLPVVDGSGELVGIITDHDIFRVLVDFCGASKGGLHASRQARRADPDFRGHQPERRQRPFRAHLAQQDAGREQPRLYPSPCDGLRKGKGPHRKHEESHASRILDG